jgi:hypothetical protein
MLRDTRGSSHIKRGCGQSVFGELRRDAKQKSPAWGRALVVDQMMTS